MNNHMSFVLRAQPVTCACGVYKMNCVKHRLV